MGKTNDQSHDKDDKTGKQGESKKEENKNNDKYNKDKKIGNFRHWLLGFYLIIMPIILVFFLLLLWHGGNDKGDAGTGIPVTTINVWENPANLFGLDIKVLPEFRLIILVILAGALGGYIHSATSFASYTGNRSFVGSWRWWYILRPFIGVALALVFYFALRGGILLLTTGSVTSNISPYGMAAISGLVGMFSKQAADKLREVFDTTFASEKGKGDDERADKLGPLKLVCDFMVRTNRIYACRLKDEDGEKNLKIRELYNMLEGGVTRIPVYTSIGAVKYVIHQSLLFKFISEKSVAGTEGQSFSIDKLTLQDFLDDDKMKAMVSGSLAFVPINATLSEAKQKMGETINCQDVFVTDNGDKNEPVRGWLTNIEIVRHLQV